MPIRLTNPFCHTHIHDHLVHHLRHCWKLEEPAAGRLLQDEPYATGDCEFDNASDHTCHGICRANTWHCLVTVQSVMPSLVVRLRHEHPQRARWAQHQQPVRLHSQHHHQHQLQAHEGQHIVPDIKGNVEALELQVAPSSSCLLIHRQQYCMLLCTLTHNQNRDIALIILLQLLCMPVRPILARKSHPDRPSPYQRLVCNHQTWHAPKTAAAWCCWRCAHCRCAKHCTRVHTC